MSSRWCKIPISHPTLCESLRTTADFQTLEGMDSPDCACERGFSHKLVTHHRSAIGTTFRNSGPMYSLSGRMIRLFSCCSIMWAHQPVTRLHTKIGV